MKKIYIMVDLEGISGISGSSYCNASQNRPDLIAEARTLMAGDINACVEGCIRGGATEVIVKDCHGGGFNVTRAMVDPRADLIDGDTPGERFADIEGSAGLILLGYHARGGTEGAVCEHTMSSTSWQHVYLNGREAGEIAIDASIAAEHGVPVIMVSGDDKTCLEASEWLPGVVTCQVKKGYSRNGARMPSLEKSRALIREKSCFAVEHASEMRPMAVTSPVRLKVELVSRCRMPDNPAYRRLDGRTWELTAESLERALFFNW